MASKSFERLLRVGDRQTLMRGRWDLVCIELSSGKARRMPGEFCEVYGTALASRHDA